MEMQIMPIQNRNNISFGHWVINIKPQSKPQSNIEGFKANDGDEIKKGDLIVVTTNDGKTNDILELHDATFNREVINPKNTEKKLYELSQVRGLGLSPTGPVVIQLTPNCIIDKYPAILKKPHEMTVNLSKYLEGLKPGIIKYCKGRKREIASQIRQKIQPEVAAIKFLNEIIKLKP
jgi:hypothetical protein